MATNSISRARVLRAGVAGAALMAVPATAAAASSPKRGQPGPDGMYAVQVRDVSWAYRDKGSGPPAVLLHSFLLSSNLWLDQLSGLADIRRCIAPDMRGWGRSEPVTDTFPDPDQYAADIVTFLDALRITEPVDLVGLSVGAFIAGLVYERIPNRVASLTLLSGTFDFPRDLPYERYQREVARLAVVEGKDTVFRRFDEYIDGPASSLHIRARYHQMLLDTRTEMLVAFLTSTGRTPPRPDLPAKIKVPVLLPIGGEDVVITPERADAMAKTFPNAEVVRVKGAGRLLSLEAPGELNAALRAFWTGRARR
jgi:pimeloyl-ACP methyl ester carboxylesterase